MPFKSEAQRRYLWANEPEIARDWADTYGSRIHKNDGGIMSMQGGVKNYLGEQKEVTAPLKWQSSPDHPTTELAYITQAEKDLLIKKDLHKSLKGGVNRGPSGIISLNGWGSSDPAQNRAGSDISAAMDASPGSGAGAAGWADTSTAHMQGPTGKSPAELSILAGQKDSSTVLPQSHYGKEYKPQGQGFNFNPLRMVGNFFGNPGKILTGIMGFKDNFLQGRGDYKDQTAWEQAKQNRINQKRIDNMLSRKGKGLDYGEQNLYDVSGGQYDFRDDQFGENQAGITGTDVAENFDVKDLITKVSDNNAMDAYWKKALGNNQYLGDNQYKHANWFTDLFKKDPEDIQIGEEGSLLDEAKDILQKKKEEAEKTKERFKDI